MAAPVARVASDLTPAELQCLQWLQTNVVASRGVALSSQQLQQLAVHVGDDAVRCAMRCCGQCCWPVLRGVILIVVVRYCWYALQTLAHTAMVAAAMSAHGEVVAWCEANTTARPWVVARALLCWCDSRGRDSLKLSHVGQWKCGVVRASALVAACYAGDMAMVSGLVGRHAECGAAARGVPAQDAVSAAVRHDIVSPGGCGAQRLRLLCWFCAVSAGPGLTATQRYRWHAGSATWILHGGL
jgi:hypothetical protein